MSRVLRSTQAAASADQRTSEKIGDGWNGRTAFELFDSLRATMPIDNPGRLSRGQYTGIVAYLLRLNGCLPDRAGLSNDPKQLERIRITTWSGS